MYMLFGIPRQRNVKETAVVGVMAMHESLGGDRRRCHSVQLAFSKRCLKAQIISLLSASGANTMHGCNALYDAKVSAQCFKSSVHELKRSSPCPI